MPWQFSVRQTSAQVVDAMEGFVQQCERQKLSGPSIGHDATGGTPGGVTAQADVLDVFPPALQISRDDAGSKVEPKKVSPELPMRHCPKNGRPDRNDQNKFGPNATADFTIVDERIFPQEHPSEEKRREQEAHIQFNEGDHPPKPTRSVDVYKGPQFLIPLRREM